jgi:hypothetical protein
MNRKNFFKEPPHTLLQNQYQQVHICTFGKSDRHVLSDRARLDKNITLSAFNGSLKAKILMKATVKHDIIHIGLSLYRRCILY